VDTEDSKILQGENRAKLEAALPDYIRGRRWFGGKARRMTSVQLAEVMPLISGTSVAYIALAEVNFAVGEPQKYVLPLGLASGQDAQRVAGAAIVDLEATDPEGASATVTIHDATFDPGFTLGLLDAIRKEETIRSAAGEIAAWRTPVFTRLDGDAERLAPSVMGAEQSNTSIRYGDRLILKLFRRLEGGTSPDLEVGRYLGAKGFANTPPLAGAIEYRVGGAEPLTLAILQGFARNQGDAWSYTLQSLEGYFERVMAQAQGVRAPSSEGQHVLDLAAMPLPKPMEQLAGDYIASARLLGERTAQLHLALGEGGDDKAFAPEPFTPAYQQAILHSMIGLTGQVFALLRDKLGDLPEATRRDAEALLAREANIRERFEPFNARAISALRTRVHGDYHLGQVLYTGGDFMIIDFEGEPVRTLAERRQKHSPLKDVAGMLRSFSYAAFSGMFSYIDSHTVNAKEELMRLEDWALAWQSWIGAAFLAGYLATAKGADILPRNQEDLRLVLDTHLLEKAVYELVYELNNRPGWVRIPLSGIAQLVG
jgi:trehalose synthase-fused probable maltokinase